MMSESEGKFMALLGREEVFLLEEIDHWATN